MLTIVETIQISETTTSCRVRIGDVNFDANLDERYRLQAGAEGLAASAGGQSALADAAAAERAPEASARKP